MNKFALCRRTELENVFRYVFLHFLLGNDWKLQVGRVYCGGHAAMVEDCFGHGGQQARCRLGLEGDLR